VVEEGVVKKIATFLRIDGYGLECLHFLDRACCMRSPPPCSDTTQNPVLTDGVNSVSPYILPSMLIDKELCEMSSQNAVFLKAVLAEWYVLHAV
jgi:hypothetical protein